MPHYINFCLLITQLFPFFLFIHLGWVGMVDKCCESFFTGMNPISLQLAACLVLSLKHTSNLSLKDYNCHDSLAVSLCNEILREPDDFGVQALCKALKSLELTKTHSGLKDLAILADSLLKVRQSFTLLKVLETSFFLKIALNIDHILSKKSEYI